VPGLHISLFRTFRADYYGKIPGCFETQRVKELFAYLLLYRRPHLRESLVTVLWGDTPPAKAKKYLRQTLWQLQAGLNDVVASEDGRVLHVDAEGVQIDPAANIELDVELFEQAYLLSREIPGRALSMQQVQALQEAIELYEGDLLEGWYQDWCLFEQERLQNIYLVILDKLMGFCEAHNNYEKGLRYGRQVLQQDAARERTHRRMMRLYYLGNNRTAALRHYDRCVKALQSELAVEPAKRTVDLYKSICEDHLLSQETQAAPQSTADITAASLVELLVDFKHLQKALEDTQRRVKKSIEAVETRLSPTR